MYPCDKPKATKSALMQLNGGGDEDPYDGDDEYVDEDVFEDDFHYSDNRTFMQRPWNEELHAEAAAKATWPGKHTQKLVDPRFQSKTDSQ